MKHLFLFLFILVIPILNANILIPGPICTELVWIDNEWFMEMHIAGEGWPPITLDECYIFSNQGSTYFSSVYFPPYTTFTVSVEDLLIPLELNPTFDEIILGWDGSENGSSCSIYFGNDHHSMTPLEGESLVRRYFPDPFIPVVIKFYCRDNTPTLIFGNNSDGFTGTFSGCIKNSNNIPVAGAVIEYYLCDGENQIVTDLNGEFSKEMYTVRYDIQVFFDEVIYIDTTMYIA